MRHEERRSDACLWAYLNDPMPTCGPGRLLDQKRIVDALAIATGRCIERYVIESGGAVTAAGLSVRLQRSIEDARASERRVTIAFASTASLGTTRDARHDALASLLAAGLIVEDPTGSLQPTALTVALAKRRAKRRAPIEVGSDVDV